MDPAVSYLDMSVDDDRGRAFFSAAAVEDHDALRESDVYASNAQLVIPKAMTRSASSLTEASLVYSECSTVVEDYDFVALPPPPPPA
jgi:3-deoxy-D-arabino-heptulosonate 7-phosphate (DAHP) synthase class II